MSGFSETREQQNLKGQSYAAPHGAASQNPVDMHVQQEGALLPRIGQPEGSAWISLPEDSTRRAQRAQIE